MIIKCDYCGTNNATVTIVFTDGDEKDSCEKCLPVVLEDYRGEIHKVVNLDEKQ